MIIDGIEKEQTLFSLVKDTLKLSKSMENGTNNSIIAFHDNSSVSEEPLPESFLMIYLIGNSWIPSRYFDSC
jgi:hypothetical protein